MTATNTYVPPAHITLATVSSTALELAPVPRAGDPPMAIACFWIAVVLIATCVVSGRGKPRAPKLPPAPRKWRSQPFDEVAAVELAT